MIRFLGWKDLNACTFWGLCLSYTRKRLSIEEKEGSKCLFVCIWDYVNSFTQWCNHTLHFVVETVIPNDLSCWKMSNHLCMQLVLLLSQTMNFLKWLHAKLHQYCSIKGALFIDCMWWKLCAECVAASKSLRVTYIQ